MKNKITLPQARKLILHGQALNRITNSPLQVIKNLGYVQIDTISVVERAHHHIFWSRCPSYKPTDLDELVSKRKVFEYWSHAAAYLPIEDYRYTLCRKQQFQNKVSDWWPQDHKVMKYVYDRIKNEGPLQSKDFKSTGPTKSGWWQWKPAKKALERLFMEGQLEISKRVGFQKVFDLTERVIPSHINKQVPTDSELASYLVKRTLKHHVLATPAEVAYLQGGKIKKLVEDELNYLVEEGELLKIAVQGIGSSYYIRAKDFEMIPSVSKRIYILSPFDNMVIQRKKLYDFFNFDYQIECYVPAVKRKYGYFCLPILVDQKFVARVDCKADRKQGILLIQSLNWENTAFKKKYKERINNKLAEFAKFNSCKLE